MDKNLFTVKFEGSATSNAADIPSSQVPIGIITPDSFGATSITFKGSTDGTTFYDVADETNTVITATVDATTGKWYDLSNIFPISLGRAILQGNAKVKLVASTSITKAVTLITVY